MSNNGWYSLGFTLLVLNTLLASFFFFTGTFPWAQIVLALVGLVIVVAANKINKEGNDELL